MTSDLRAIASKLSGEEVGEVIFAADRSTQNESGDKVYMVATASRLLTLKHYGGDREKSLLRLENERNALELMNWYGISAVSQWLAGEENYALMSWPEGETITTPTTADIDELAVFLGTLHHISHKVQEEDMPALSDSCRSGALLVEHMERSVAALMPVATEYKPLMEFLSRRFMPLFAKRLMATKKSYPEFSAQLPHEQRTLIIADLSFNKSLRAVDGSLYFTTCEPFGWDDPARLISDIILQLDISDTNTAKKADYNKADYIKSLTAYAASIYGSDITRRLMALYPLFGMYKAIATLALFAEETTEDNEKIAALAKAEKFLAASEELKI